MLAIVFLLGSLITAVRARVGDDDTGKNWAVLIAGSRSYYNYRHQSDVCHAYHTISNKGGIPDERIIVMMADDIAESESNPFKGNVINVPNGPNVYPGVKKDYTGTAVNKQTFLQVLTGQTSDNVTKVLKSTEKDNVFVYFVDHGAAGLVCMPYGPELYADELLAAIKTMHKNKMYKKLVFYLEACESGSMFQNILPSNLSAYAVTAAGASESSYACYWDEKRMTYLADQFSINFLKDSDAHMLKNETLDQQFMTVVAETFSSTSHRYGSMDFDKDLVEDYQGQSGNHSIPTPGQIPPNCSTPVSSRDIRLETLKRRWEGESDSKIRDELEREIEAETARRVHIEYTFREIVHYAIGKDTELPRDFNTWFGLHAPPTDFEGMRRLNTVFKEACFEFDEFSLQFFTVLVSLNEKLGEEATSTVEKAIRAVCNRKA